MKQRLYKGIIALFLLLASGPAPAAETADTLQFIGLYDFDFAEIHLGSLELSIDQSPQDYTVKLAVRSGGIVNLFTRHSDDTEATGTHTLGHFAPRLYETFYKTKNKPRHIRFAYDSNGVMTQEIVEPPEDRNERPLAPQNLKDGSYDPLTGLLAVRTGLLNWRGFDGKHLYQVTAQAVPHTTDLHLQVGECQATSYLLMRKPLAGMTHKEMKEYNEKGEPALALYFSDDAKRIPLAVNVPLLFSRVRGVLVKECKAWDACKP